MKINASKLLRQGVGGGSRGGRGGGGGGARGALQPPALLAPVGVQAKGSGTSAQRPISSGLRGPLSSILLCGEEQEQGLRPGQLDPRPRAADAPPVGAQLPAAALGLGLGRLPEPDPARRHIHPPRPGADVATCRPRAQLGGASARGRYPAEEEEKKKKKSTFATFPMGPCVRACAVARRGVARPRRAAVCRAACRAEPRQRGWRGRSQRPSYL